MQSKFSTWQTLPRSSVERRTLQRELEEDCASLEYMVRALLLLRGASLVAGRVPARVAATPGWLPALGCLLWGWQAVHT